MCILVQYFFNFDGSFSWGIIFMPKYFWVRICIKPNLVLSHFRVGGEGPKIEVAQNGPEHILVLEFLKCDEIFGILQVATHKQANIQPTALMYRTTQ